MEKIYKLYNGVVSDYMILKTNAPKEVVNTQLIINSTLLEENVNIENPFYYIEKNGYYAQIMADSNLSNFGDDIKYDYLIDVWKYME